MLLADLDSSTCLSAQATISTRLGSTHAADEVAPNVVENPQASDHISLLEIDDLPKKIWTPKVDADPRMTWAGLELELHEIDIERWVIGTKKKRLLVIDIMAIHIQIRWRTLPTTKR